MEELENTNSIMGNVNSDNATDASNLEQDPTPEQQRQELS